MLTSSRFWISRNRESWLVDFRREKPVNIDGSFPLNGNASITIMTVSVFVSLFGFEPEPGECREVIVSIEGVQHG